MEIKRAIHLPVGSEIKFLGSTANNHDSTGTI
jgi:hypothetical protein